METPEVQEPLLDAQVVAKWLDVAVTTVYEQAARGVLPHVRLWKGTRRTLIRFRKGDVERFIRDRAVKPRGQRG